MANTDKVVVTKSKLTAIADAIRSKNSTTDKMSLDSIPAIIANLKTARLNTPTISWDGSSRTLTITNPSTNGNFADGYYIYKDGAKVYTYTSTLGQGTSYSYNMGSIGDNVTAVFTAAIWANDMVESDKPASITYGHYTVTQTLSSHLQTDSAPTSKYHNQPITETISISVASTEGSEQTALTPIVTNPSSSSYTFAIPYGQTYYESTNKGKSSTYAYGKFAFTATTACRVYVQYVSSGESSYDYGIISKVDKELSKSDNGDTASGLVAVSASGKPSTETKTVCIGDVNAGEHYFTAKFRKDGSVDKGNDSLRIIGIYFNSLTISEHVYLPSNIECTYANGTIPDYTWDPFTGALSIPKVQGKLTIIITESNTGLLRPSTLTRKKTVLTWTAVAGATSYEIHAFSDSMADRAIYTGTDLTFDFSTVITEEGKYTIYVVAKADGFQDSPTTGASRISFYYIPNLDDVLANNTWEVIAKACSHGMAADLWKVGDEKTVTLTNGKKYTIQIADLTEGRYKTASGDSCHATFIFKNCSESRYQWNTSSTNEGGWPSSYVRNTVMKNILALIPAELADFLLSVKITSNGGSRHHAADLASDGDKLFLPSAYEIYGDDPNNFSGRGAGYFKNDASYAGETTGGQFGLFATYTSQNDFGRAPLSNSTSYKYWWLRSPFGTDDAVLGSNSRGSGTSPANSIGHVVPCFAM